MSGSKPPASGRRHLPNQSNWWTSGNPTSGEDVAVLLPLRVSNSTISGQSQEDAFNTKVNVTLGPTYENTLVLCNPQALHNLPVNATCQAFQTVSLCLNPPRPPPLLFNLISECGIVRRHNTHTYLCTHTHSLSHRKGKVCSRESVNCSPRCLRLAGM